ncbi:MAG: hydroxymethylbilane synthase, partial [Lysobacterales bacterium]
MNIKVGTRSSKLALIQIDEIDDLLKTCGCSYAFERVAFESKGDLDKKTPLSDINQDNVFTDQLDQALLDGVIDIAIHSAKDLPQNLPDGLEILALTQSLDTTDCLVSHKPLVELGVGAKVGTSSVLRREALLDLNPSIKPTNIRGTVIERLEMFKNGEYDAIIVATIALKRLGMDEYITEILPWEGTALQGQLAVVGRRGDYKLRALFTSIDVRPNYGSVYLVGAGPGDPELITLKGIRALNEADVVLYDYLTHKDILKHAPKAELVYTGKRKGFHSITQDKLNLRIKEEALKGKTVVRLKCGDPLIFGRGTEEITYLQSYHINVHVIPGVSAATGIASLLGVPLTSRNISSSVSFISAHVKNEANEESPIVVPNTDTLVYLMGLTKLQHIITSLLNKGFSKDKPIVVISRGSYIDQEVITGTLNDIYQKVQ